MSFEDEFRVVWSSSTIFNSVPFDDIVDSITTTSVWTGNIWSHTFVIEYKPEAPIDHVTFSAAALELANTDHEVDYCGCAVNLSVTADVQSSYNMNTSSGKSGKSVKSGKSGKSGKCKNAYTPPNRVRRNTGEWHVQRGFFYCNDCRASDNTPQTTLAASTGRHCF